MQTLGTSFLMPVRQNDGGAFIAGWLAIGLLVAGCGTASSRIPPAPNTPAQQSARLDLSEVARLYGSAETYFDSGIIETRSQSGKKVVKTFTTAFARRPLALRFSYQFRRSSRPPTYQIVLHVTQDSMGLRGSDRSTAVWNSEESSVTLNELEMQIASITGISSGVAHMVPSLLLPKMVRGHSLDSTRYEPLPGALLRDVSCARFRMKRRTSETTLWVDRKTRLIRRLETKRTAGPARGTSHIVTYSPRIGAVIPPEMLSPGFTVPPNDPDEGPITN